MFSDESALVKVKDEKIAELTQAQEKNQFTEIDQWIAEHGDEFPFDSPEANQPAGYIEIRSSVVNTINRISGFFIATERNIYERMGFFMGP